MGSSTLNFDAGDSGRGRFSFYEERIRFFRDKLNVPTDGYQDLWREQHNAGFMVAGAYNADLLDDLRRSVDAAIARGISLDEFRRDFSSIVARHGWQFNGTPGWRSRLIYETNLRTAHAAGRYQQKKQPAMVQVRPYWRYNHNDRVQFPRVEHVSWDGTILMHDDPWWSLHYPPGGYGCRCFVDALGARDMARLGKLEPDQAPAVTFREFELQDGTVIKVPDGIDPGFDYIPGQEPVDMNTLRLMIEKAEKKANEIGEQLRQSVIEDAAQIYDLDEVLEAGQEIRRDLYRRRRDYINDNPGIAEDVADAWMADELKRLAKAANPRPVQVQTVNKRGKVVDWLRGVSDILPASWVTRVNDIGRLHVKATQSRAFQVSLPIDAPRRSYRIQGFGSMVAEGGDGMLVAGSPGVTMHEFMHRMQFTLPGLDDLFQRLHIRRTARDDRELLRDLTGIDGYRLSEVARKDDYIDAYFGKEYPEEMLYDGRLGPALEVITMAFQYTLAGSPAEFRRMLDGDPELVALVLGALFKWRP